MRYKIIDNYIDQSTCQKLVQDYTRFVSTDLYRFQGGRRTFSNTSLNCINLIEKSESWADLAYLFSSRVFLDECLSELGINEPLESTSLIADIGKRFKWLRSKASSPLRHTSFRMALLWYSYLCIINTYVAFSSLIARMRNKVLVEMFFDLSSASNGYSREIHRDTENRVFIFLLYLNDLEASKTSSGGNLRLYSPTTASSMDPQPDASQVACIESVEPKAGRLVVFENTEDAYHDVELMRGYDKERFFCYGALTRLQGRHSKLRKSIKNYKTDFRGYY